MSDTIFQWLVGMFLAVSCMATGAWVLIGVCKVLDWFSKVNGYADDIQWNDDRLATLECAVNKEMRTELHALKERVSQLEGKKK